MFKDLQETAVDAARAGGEVLRRHFRQGNLEIEAKAANDWVSKADRESERAVVEAILSRFPDHQVLGEEGGSQGSPGDADVQWIVDPLDGTTNFLRGLPIFCVSVACQVRGETSVGVVLDPEGGQLFSAARGLGATLNGKEIRVSRRGELKGAFLATGFPFRNREVLERYLHTLGHVFDEVGAIRRCGAAALDLAYTAAGIFDGFWEFRLASWDMAAGALLIEEAGGRVTDLDGGDGFLQSGNIVGGSPGVHRELLSCIQQDVNETMLGALLDGR